MAPGEAGKAQSGAPGKSPNLVLRRIREQERHETREEFAEAMTRVARELGEDVIPDAKYVARLETGDIRYPRIVYRRILAKLCSRPFGELGFSPPPVLSTPASRDSLSPDSLDDDSAGSAKCSNVALRTAIMASGLELPQVARKVGVDPKSVQRWITRGVVPHPRHRWKMCEVLGRDEPELWPGAVSAQPASGRDLTLSNDRSFEEEQEEVERRRLLQSLAVLGVSVSPLSQALGTVRTAIGKAVGYDERNHLSYWEDATVEYGYSYLYASPSDLVPDLASDLLTVRSIIRRIPDRDSVEYRSWCRVGGALSALMAKSLSNLGYSRNSREWWSMAHYLTDASNDRHLALLVRGEHIIHGLYENRPVPVLLRQVKSAAEIASSQPSVGLLDLIGARAQVFAMAGDYRSAEEDLHRTQEILERIPPSSEANGAGLVMFWGEAELRYTEAWVYSQMGEVAKTDRAADQAFSLYPASDKRSPVQIKLMQAFTRVRRGDITKGIQHAQAVYEPLAFERTTMVDALAGGVLNSIPAEAWKRPDVAEYRALVTSRIPERKAIEA